MRVRNEYLEELDQLQQDLMRIGVLTGEAIMKASDCLKTLNGELARQGLNLAKQALTSGKYQMVILDEINVALDFKLIPLEEVIEMIRTKPAAADLVLTGRYAPAELIELAETVSDVREVKHHYAQGIKERAGIEF